MRLFRRRATGLVPLHHFHFNLRFPEALDRIHPLNAVLNGPFAAHRTLDIDIVAVAGLRHMSILRGCKEEGPQSGCKCNLSYVSSHHRCILPSFTRD